MVAQGVERAKAFLRVITQVDCVSLQRENKAITWNARKPGIFKNVYYPLEYQYLIDDQQYSLLLSDGSFFQFYYEFSKTDVLLKARLAYYPSPMPTVDSKESISYALDMAAENDDSKLLEHFYNWVEVMEHKGLSPSNTSHIRFDYDSKVKVHDPAHIQFGGIQEFRVPSEFFPLPLVFVKLCLSMLLLPDEHVNKCDITFENRNTHALSTPMGGVFLASSK